MNFLFQFLVTKKLKWFSHGKNDVSQTTDSYVQEQCCD